MRRVAGLRSRGLNPLAWLDPTTLKIALAQLNPTVGDVAGNLAKARAARARGGRGSAPTSSCSPSFSSPAIRRRTSSSSRPSRTPAARPARRSPARPATAGRRCSIGTPWVEDGKLYNAFALLDGGAGRRRCATRSTCRTTASSTRSASSRRARCPGPVGFRGVRLGVPICEDIWGERGRRVPRRDRRRDPARAERLALLARQDRRAPATSPSRASSRAACRSSISTRSAARTSSSSTAPPSASTPTATLAFQMPAFRETRRAHRLGDGRRAAGAASTAPRRRWSRKATRPTSAPACSGLRDYVDKNGFPGVVLGLSGGIDSALCAAMAVDALGPERVHCVMLPYRYTSNE